MTAMKKQIKKQEMFCKDRIDCVPDWIWEIDLDGDITYSNIVIAELLGYQSEEIIGKQIFSIMPPADAQKCTLLLDIAISDGKSIRNIITHFISKDHSTKTVEVSCVPMLDDTDELIGFRGVSRDITDQLAQQKNAREVEASYRALVENSPTGIFIVQNGLVVFVNPMICELMGYTEEKAIGESIWKFVHSDDKTWLKNYHHRRLAGEDAPSQYVARGITKSGEIKYLDFRSTLIQYKGTPAILLNAVDITDRELVEDALRDSEQRLLTIISFLPDATFAIDLEGKLIVWNKAMEELSGIKAEDVLGKADYDYSIPFYGVRRPMLIDIVLKPYKEIETLYPSIQRDGVTLTTEIAAPSLRPNGYIWSKAAPLYDSQGNMIGAIETARDITERKLTEQALQEAETKYRSLVEETLTGVYLVQDNRFIYVNPRMAEIYGYTQDELIGTNPLDTVAIPEEREQVMENIRKRLSGEAKSIRYSFKSKRKDGYIIDVEVYGSRTIYNGKPAIIGSLMDITERKRAMEALRDSEERYRLLFEHSPDMVIMIKDNVITDANPATFGILGYKPEEMTGFLPWDISPEFQPDGMSSREKAISILEQQPRVGLQRFEWTYKHKGGALVECEVGLVSYKVHEEMFIQAITRDITQRKQAEENRRKLERDLEAQKRSFYRETIRSVTNGKLDIRDDVDLRPYITSAQLRMDVNNAAEVSDVRRQVEEFINKHGLEGERLDLFMIGVGEAITNAIKHGIQGQVYMGSDEESVWVGVSDKGRGIESLILPRATLLRGFSTKPSMGLGYSIMLDVADRILLNTGEHGTTVILIKNLKEMDLAMVAERLPDTWNNIPG